MEEVTADVVATARELELKVEPEYVSEWLQTHAKILTNEELFLLYEKGVVSGDGISSW